MNNRFIIGASIAAFGNALLTVILVCNHDLMATQPAWQYMLFFSWWPWAALFGLSAVGTVAALMRGHDRRVRFWVGFGVVFHYCWIATLVLVAFDPDARRITLFIPTLIFLVASFELLFLAIQARDWLDKIRPHSTTGLTLTGDDTFRSS